MLLRAAEGHLFGQRGAQARAAPAGPASCTAGSSVVTAATMDSRRMVLRKELSDNDGH
ncbi:hypothetical protein AB0I02_27480 [Streptomyces phaeochromogenes]